MIPKLTLLQPLLLGLSLATALPLQAMSQTPDSTETTTQSSATSSPTSSPAASGQRPAASGLAYADDLKLLAYNVFMLPARFQTMASRNVPD